jgi:hypothetical protein
MHGVTQAVNMSVRLVEELNVIPVNEAPEDCDYLVLLPRRDGTKIEWDDSIRTIEPPPTQLIPFGLESPVVSQLKELPKSGAHEIELFALPASVGKRSERPRLLYTLLVSDSASFFVLGLGVFEAVNGIDLMYASLAENVSSRWAENEVVPEEIRVRSMRLATALEPLADELGVSISLVNELPAIADVKRSLFEQLQG